MKHRYVLRYAIDGDLRFISHKDTMRMWQRVLLRANLPVKYSEGFNPRVRLSLPLPRSVGTAGADEVLVFEMSEELNVPGAEPRLREQTPSGVEVFGVWRMPDGKFPRPIRATYRVPLGSSAENQELRDDGVVLDRSALRGAIDRFLAGDARLIRRVTPGRRAPKVRNVDLRPLVESLEVSPEHLQMVLPVDPAGSARPVDVLEALGLPPEDWAHRLRRTHVEWDPPWPR